jgi:hypothetical protein
MSRVMFNLYWMTTNVEATAGCSATMPQTIEPATCHRWPASIVIRRNAAL